LAKKICKNKEPKKEYLNEIYLGEELIGGTLGFQPEHYQGFKYLKKILLFFKDQIENNTENNIKFLDLKSSLFKGFEENISDLVFVQLRILKNVKNTQKVDDREFLIGDFGKFLLTNYIQKNYETMLLAAYILFSVIPMCIYDLQNLINLELNAKNLKRTEIYSQVNKTKQILLLNLLGIYSSQSSYTYKTIPLFELVKKDEKNNTVKIIKSKRISFKKQAAIICLDYAIEKIIKTIKKLKNLHLKDFITMEDLYLYLVRPDLLKDYIPKYEFQVFINFTYPFSNMFYFLRNDDLLENDDIDLFYEIFYAVNNKHPGWIRVDEMYDPILIQKLKTKVLAKKLYWLNNH